MKLKIKNEQGSALVLVILLMFFVSIVGLGLMRISANSLNQVDHERTDQAVYYIAEAGLNIVKPALPEILRKVELEALDDLHRYLLSSTAKYTEAELEEKYSEFLSNKFTADDLDLATQTIKLSDREQATITYTLDPATHTVHMQSKGSVVGATTRTLNQSLKLESKLYAQNGVDPSNPGEIITPAAPPNSIAGYAAITSGDLSLGGNSKILGNVLVGGTIKPQKNPNIIGTIEMGHPEKFDPNDFIPPFPDDEFIRLNQLQPPANGTITDQKNAKIEISNGNLTTSAPTFTYPISTDTKFKNLNVKKHNELIFNIGDKEIDLYIDDYYVAGKLSILGTGTLNLYVKKFSDLSGSINLEGNPSQINMYYVGESPLSLSGGIIYGSLYNKVANLTFTGGVEFYGNIFSGGNNISIKGGVPSKGQYIVAPNAHLELVGGGNITGLTIVESISLTGGTSITYGNPVVPLPPSVNPQVALPGTPTSTIKELSTIEE